MFWGQMGPTWPQGHERESTVAGVEAGGGLKVPRGYSLHDTLETKDQTLRRTRTAQVQV